jgi:hypothetical protein
MQETLYSTRLEELFWGGLLMAITMAIHGLGMLFTVQWTNRLKAHFTHPPGLAIGIALLIVASWMILLVHLLEVSVWANFFVLTKGMANRSVSFYFALLQYTTVGSSLNLPLKWRLLEGMLAIAGLMTFAWSTSVLYTLAQEFQEEQLARHRARARKGPAPSAPSEPKAS